MVEDSLARAPDGLTVKFSLTDMNKTVPVAYRGNPARHVPRGPGHRRGGPAGRLGASSAPRRCWPSTTRPICRPRSPRRSRSPADGADRGGARAGGNKRGRQMIAEMRPFRLVLALLLAVVQGIVPMLGAARGDAAMMAAGRPAAIGQLVLTALAFGCLIQLFVVSDFSVALVANNSHTLKPLLYKISGVWANHEGLDGAVGADPGTVRRHGRGLRDQPAGRPQGARAVGPGPIAAGFFAFIIFTSNPFLRLDPRRSKAAASTRCSKTPGSPSIRRSSISAMSGSRSRSRSPSPP